MRASSSCAATVPISYAGCATTVNGGSTKPAHGTSYSMPLASNPSYELNGDGCRFDCTVRAWSAATYQALSRS